MHHLDDLAPEVLHSIFLHVEPADLAALSRSCHSLNSFIRNDILLWKLHYLTNFDAPKTETSVEEGFWKGKLTKVVALQKLLESGDQDVKRAHLVEVTKSAIDLLESRAAGSYPSQNVAFLTRLIKSGTNKSNFLSRSSLFRKAGLVDETPASEEAERQLSAKLHVYYGSSIESSDEDVQRSLANPVHPIARSRVYDLRRYTDHNFWGPFLDDGSQGIDWEKVEAILVVLGYNLRVLAERTDGQFSLVWDKPFTGLAENSFVSRSLACLKKQPQTPLDIEDPYGVTGTWMRIVCFLDYNNLYQFNFENERIPDDQEREPICTEEAIRLIFLKLKVSKIEEPGEEDGQDMPVVHFTGTSRSMHMSWDPNANSKIRGTVRTTPKGAIRWTTFSIYHGEERWRSEGVQIGGLRSARGILGTWFDKDFDIHGPAGPSSFWKLSDDVVEEKSPTVHPFPFTAFF